MVDHDALIAAFSHYSNVLLGGYKIGEVLYRLADQAVSVLGVDGAGVSIAEDDVLRFVAATDSDIAQVEAQQENAANGPCHDAYHSGEIVAVSDLRAETRWDAYRQVALEQGVRAAAGVPMPSQSKSVRIGALNLYQREPRAWEDTDLQVAQTLANMASGYVLNQAELGRRESLATHLQTALDSRVVIEQAKGVLAGRHDVSPAVAFSMLRTHARSHSMRLHELCRQVVEGEVELDPPE